MLTIIWRTIKDRKIALISYIVAGVLFMLMYVSMFPSIQDQAEEFDQLFEAYPKEFTEIFNIETIGFDTIEKFLAIEQYSIVWPLMVIFLMVSFAGMALAREIEKGTIEILLSRPVSRLNIFLSRYLAGVSVLLTFTIFSIFSLVPLAEIFGIDYKIENNFTTSIVGFLFGLCIFSLAMMLSAVFSEKSRAYMVTGGVLFLMYVLRIISSVMDDFEDLKYLSFFNYFDANKTMIDNELSLTVVLVFGLSSIIFTFIGAFWFNKRDIAV